MEMMSSANAEKILEPTGDEALATENMSADLRQRPSASDAGIAAAKYMSRNRSMLHKTEGAKLSQGGLRRPLTEWRDFKRLHHPFRSATSA